MYLFFRLCDLEEAGGDEEAEGAEKAHSAVADVSSRLVTTAAASSSSDQHRRRLKTAPHWRAAVRNDVIERQQRVVQALLRHENAKYFKYDKNRLARIVVKSAKSDCQSAADEGSGITDINADEEKSISTTSNTRNSTGCENLSLAVKESDNINCARKSDHEKISENSENSNDEDSYDELESIEWKSGR